MSIAKHAYVADGIDCSVCPLPKSHPVHDVPRQPSLTPPGSPAAEMNALGSTTGRVTTMTPATSTIAARKAPASNHRAIALRALQEAGVRGLTSIELAALLPAQSNGQPQSSSRAVTRLGELWEAHEAAIKRPGGNCDLGRCHSHQKPNLVHTPSAPCGWHGQPETRGGANVWVSLRPIL